ncbi:MAG: transcription antitermination factor NusB [Phycisphaerales bacterium]
MATPRDIRRLALLALYQFDALKAEGADANRASIRESLDNLEALEEEGLTFADPNRAFSDADKDKAVTIAEAAWDNHESSDAVFAELAPEWPAHRMPAVDRAVLRLCHYEMHSGSQPKIVVNEGVELAKQFSTKDSPNFVNAVLDKVLKKILANPAVEQSAATESE